MQSTGGDLGYFPSCLGSLCSESPLYPGAPHDASCGETSALGPRRDVTLVGHLFPAIYRWLRVEQDSLRNLRDESSGYVGYGCLSLLLLLCRGAGGLYRVCRCSGRRRLQTSRT
ncbi:hypothetical protein BJY01DRAFT_18381 [Aspergillus pseudoustus]|uniref:Uncharacterized protein n=1 Tax=Aspergillus pseudoustus TaxID=1810923 RepID=A0ABR4KRM0_9EURO